jgi:hypothetical protein
VAPTTANNTFTQCGGRGSAPRAETVGPFGTFLAAAEKTVIFDITICGYRQWKLRKPHWVNLQTVSGKQLTDMKSIIILTSFFLFACSTLRQINPLENPSTLSPTSISNLDGNYDIRSSDTVRTTLDFALTFKKYGRFDTKAKYSVSIKAINDRHIQTDILKNDSLLKSKIIKGKFDNGYFVFRNKKLSPFYFIFNVFGSKITRLGQLKSGDLIVDCSHFQVATLVVIPLAGGRDEEYNVVFRRQSASD